MGLSSSDLLPLLTASHGATVCRTAGWREQWKNGGSISGGTAAAVSSRLYGVLTTELLRARFTAASGTDCWTQAVTHRSRKKKGKDFAFPQRIIIFEVIFVDSKLTVI